jgi:secretion/DNA translocation related TadE-like protein
LAACDDGQRERGGGGRTRCRERRSAMTIGVRRDRERGSASIWVLTCSALVLLVGIVAAMRASAVLARHRAESATGLAALAAAARIGFGGEVCAAAAPIAAANGAALLDCRADLAPDGLSGTVVVRVRVEVHLAGWAQGRVVASARAGRMPA